MNVGFSKQYTTHRGVIGQLDPGRHQTLIVGAGMAGLLAGYVLKKAGKQVKILEKSDRPGGLVQSYETRFGPIEAAANGILFCPEWEQIVDDLGITPVPSSESSKKRYLLRKDAEGQPRLTRWPLSPLETLSFVFHILKPLSPSFKARLDDMGLRNFSNHCFGQAFTNQVLDAAMGGIYAGDINLMGANTALFRLTEIVKRSTWFPLAIYRMFKTMKGPPDRKYRGLHSFENGMQGMVDALAEHLHDEIQLNTPIETFNDLPRDANVILTTPAYITKILLQSVSGEISETLNSIDYLPLVSINCLVKKASLKRFKPGFGFLIPRKEGFRVLGVLFSSLIFPDLYKDESYVSLRVMLGGANDRDILSLPESTLIEIIQRELREIIGLDESLTDYHIDSYDKALPHYELGLSHIWSRLGEALNKHPGLLLFGNYTGEISLRGLAQAAFQSLSR